MTGAATRTCGTIKHRTELNQIALHRNRTTESTRGNEQLRLGTARPLGKANLAAAQPGGHRDRTVDSPFSTPENSDH